MNKGEKKARQLGVPASRIGDKIDDSRQWPWWWRSGGFCHLSSVMAALVIKFQFEIVVFHSSLF